MRPFTLLSVSLLTLGLNACSSGTKEAKPAVQKEVQAPLEDSATTSTSSDDHHKGEMNVQPHDHSPAIDHVDDPNAPAHGHSSSHDDSNLPPHRH